MKTTINSLILEGTPEEILQYQNLVKEQSKVNHNLDIKVQVEIGSEVDAQKADLEKLLQQYYDLKLSGLTDGSKYKELEQQIAAIKESIYQCYTK